MYKALGWRDGRDVGRGGKGKKERKEEGRAEERGGRGYRGGRTMTGLGNKYINNFLSLSQVSFCAGKKKGRRWPLTEDHCESDI